MQAAGIARVYLAVPPPPPTPENPIMFRHVRYVCFDSVSAKSVMLLSLALNPHPSNMKEMAVLGTCQQPPSSTQTRSGKRVEEELAGTLRPKPLQEQNTEEGEVACFSTHSHQGKAVAARGSDM